jgi:hypothetical protein
MIDAVKEWLSLPNNTRWLMIYDYYNNPKFPGNTDPVALNIREFLTESSRFSHYNNTVVTSRNWSSYPNQKAGKYA